MEGGQKNAFRKTKAQARLLTLLYNGHHLGSFHHVSWGPGGVEGDQDER